MRATDHGIDADIYSSDQYGGRANAKLTLEDLEMLVAEMKSLTQTHDCISGKIQSC